MSEALRLSTTVLLALILWTPFRTGAEAAADRLSDPTRPPLLGGAVQAPASNQSQVPSLRLQAVFTGPKGEAALINGRLINPGERIAGALLREVGSSGVLLERDGQTWEMPLGVSPIKQPAGQYRSTKP